MRFSGVPFANNPTRISRDLYSSSNPIFGQ